MAEDIGKDLQSARAGDRAAFGRLVKRYQRRVYVTAYRMTGNPDDAADVAQDAFIRAFRKLDTFDQRSDFFTWLYRVVMNVALNHLRRVRRHPTASLEEVEIPVDLCPEGPPDPARQLELKRQVADVQAALDELPDTLRATVVLVILEGMSYKDAAAVLECSDGTVGWRVHEARQKLQARLRGYLEPRGGGKP